MHLLKEFFGFGGYERKAEGYFSWQHLLFVSILALFMIIFAVYFGTNNKYKNFKDKNRVLVFSAILIDSLELFKIILISFRNDDIFHFLYDLPLFLCSIQLITIPIAAFSKGRLKEASLDFVTIFGLLGAIMGIYFAGNNYGTYPVLSFDNVISGLTHCISGFVSLYLIISRMTSMKKENIRITLGILLGFCIAAYIANIFTDSNYMFLSRGDGTPYDIIFNLVNGNALLYPIIVVLLFVIYIAVYYYVYYKIRKSIKND